MCVNCPLQLFMMSSGTHYSGMPINSVFEPAMKVSGYFQETIVCHISFSCPAVWLWVEGDQENCSLSICIIFFCAVFGY